MPRAAPTSWSWPRPSPTTGPRRSARRKIKKDAGRRGLTLELVRNPDILAELGHAPHDGTVVIGFAAETEADDERLLALGRAKLAARAPTSSSSTGSAGHEGFATDENAVVVLGAGGDVVTRAHGSKTVGGHAHPRCGCLGRDDRGDRRRRPRKNTRTT